MTKRRSKGVFIFKKKSGQHRRRGTALPCPYNYLYLTNWQSAVTIGEDLIKI
jgi:hypothetical protein